MNKKATLRFWKYVVVYEAGCSEGLQISWFINSWTWPEFEGIWVVISLSRVAIEYANGRS